MKKILLVGDGNHQLLRYLVKWLKNDNTEELVIDVLSITEIREEAFYNNIYYVKPNVIMSKIPKIRAIWLRRQLFKQLQTIHNNYDVINFHYITPQYLDMLKINFSAKVLLSVWGSDFYRASKEDKLSLKKMMDKSDLLTVTNPQMKKDIEVYYKNSTPPIVTMPFGLEPLENLKNNNITKEKSRKVIGAKKEEIVVCVGYNRSVDQHHIDILHSIDSILTDNEKERIFILLPLTYGSDMKYVEEIKTYLAQFKIRHKIFFEFMTNDEVAILRQATDIFIQLQTTDQLSGSMIEHMYAKNLIITGSWLPYKILEENDIYFRKIDTVDEIGKELAYCIENLNDEIAKVQKNDKITYALTSWPEVIYSWYKVYGLR